jgi:3-hydroxyacyl-CoA dehydrogenase
MGRFGQKTSAGWYDYPGDGRSAVPSAAVRQLLEAAWQASGRTGPPLSDQDIVERLVLALVKEGAALLAEGIAERASDIDLVQVFGYGFPAHRGGPMFWAGQRGWGHVRASMQGFARSSADVGFWQVPALIETWSSTGGPPSQVGGKGHP